MSRPVTRGARIGKRWGGGASLVGALCAAGAVVASCDSPPIVEPTFPAFVLVASSKGAPGGSVIACGAKFEGTLPPGLRAAVPAGIAANDSAVFVSYMEGEDTVIARVEP